MSLSLSLSTLLLLHATKQAQKLISLIEYTCPISMMFLSIVRTLSILYISSLVRPPAPKRQAISKSNRVNPFARYLANKFSFSRAIEKKKRNEYSRRIDGQRMKENRTHRGESISGKPKHPQRPRLQPPTHLHSLNLESVGIFFESAFF